MFAYVLSDNLGYEDDPLTKGNAYLERVAVFYRKDRVEILEFFADRPDPRALKRAPYHVLFNSLKSDFKILVTAVHLNPQAVASEIEEA